MAAVGGTGSGMSQYGAQGYALDGWRYPRILGHYYPGTDLQILPGRRVRVLLLEGRASVLIGSAKPFRVVDARGKKRVLKPGNRRFSVQRHVGSGSPSGSSRVHRRFGSTGARTAAP